MWGEGGDTEGVVEGSRGCEPQTDPTCSQNFAPPERGEPGRTPEGSQIMASPPNRGSSSRPCCSTGAHSCMHLPWFSSWLLAVIWDPFRVHLGCVAFPGVRTCEHAGSVWGSHPRLPSMTPSVSGAADGSGTLLVHLETLRQLQEWLMAAAPHPDPLPEGEGNRAA